MNANGWDAPAAQGAAPRDPFAASLSGMPTGQYAAPPPRGQTPEPAEPSFDDILQSFQAPTDESAFAPPPASYSPQPLPPSSASGTWAAPGTPPQNPAWQQPQPYASSASWQAASPAASQSSLRPPQPPISPDQWGQPPAAAQNPTWQASNAGNPQQAWAASRADAFALSDLAAQGTGALPVAPPSAQPATDVRELRQDEDAIRRQVATLRDVVAPSAKRRRRWRTNGRSPRLPRWLARRARTPGGLGRPADGAGPPASPEPCAAISRSRSSGSRPPV